MIASQVFLASAVVVSAIGAGTDIRTGHIPNVLTLGTLAVAPLVHLAWAGATFGMAAGLQQLGLSLLGVLVCAALPLLLYAIGAMFGGDVKLLGAVGAIVLPRVGFEAVVYAFIAAAVLSVLKMAWDGKLARVLANTANLALNPLRGEARKRPLTKEMMTIMRFGPAIFVGVAVAAFLHWGEP